MTAPASAVRRSLRSRLRAGEQVVGALVRMPCEEVVEMLAVADLDFVIIDCEHGSADVMALRQHIALAEVHGMAVLVRTGAHEDALVLRALDQGAQGVVAPHVDSAADAAALVRAAHYPPLGERGFATYPRAGRFGSVTGEEHRRTAAEDTLVIAMLESPRAAKHATEILGTDGIDGYLIGTADLRASTSQVDAPLAESIAKIHAAGVSTGSRRADLAGDPEEARTALSSGSHLVVYNVVQVLMRVFHDLRSVRH